MSTWVWRASVATACEEWGRQTSNLHRLSQSLAPEVTSVRFEAAHLQRLLVNLLDVVGTEAAPQAALALRPGGTLAGIGLLSSQKSPTVVALAIPLVSLGLPVLGERYDLARLPYSMKILLENLLRHEDGVSVLPAHIEAVAQWDPKAEPDTEIAFMPARVVLQDFTGVPCVVDLAAMRDAIAALGGDPKRNMWTDLGTADLGYQIYGSTWNWSV